jgi:hypothetical protein
MAIEVITTVKNDDYVVHSVRDEKEKSTVVVKGDITQAEKDSRVVINLALMVGFLPDLKKFVHTTSDHTLIDFTNLEGIDRDAITSKQGIISIQLSRVASLKFSFQLKIVAKSKIIEIGQVDACKCLYQFVGGSSKNGLMDTPISLFYFHRFGRSKAADYWNKFEKQLNVHYQQYINGDLSLQTRRACLMTALQAVSRDPLSKAQLPSLSRKRTRETEDHTITEDEFNGFMNKFSKTPCDLMSAVVPPSSQTMTDEEFFFNLCLSEQEPEAPDREEPASKRTRVEEIENEELDNLFNNEELTLLFDDDNDFFTDVGFSL